jgi:nitrite reductase/ring-hydroxylating ferredoxin subunit
VVSVEPGSSALRAGDRICASAALRNGGIGVRFSVTHGDRIEPAFAVRHHDRAVAYLNRCAHRHVEMDWEEGNFFDADRRLLICATHGALYEPLSGFCVTGPCHGESLVPLAVLEHDDSVWLAEPAEVVVK